MNFKNIASCLFAASLACTSNLAHAGKKDDKLRIAQALPLNTIDPYYSTYLEVFIVVGEMTFDSLVYKDPDGKGYEPLLATSWEYKDDKTIEFTLRKGVTWHDGTPLTVADVLYTFNYILDPSHRTVRREYYSFIDHVDADGDDKVVIHLKAPYGPLMEMINVLPILPQGWAQSNTL